ncbi:MAG TPA: TIGR00730 family Rossman fold protein [Vicinamibacteria bacterium]|nr:TIGR00730 family Rossman fold protein [Vicinamibacteria bacterium]
MGRVCVYCASSTEAHPDHYAAARTLGRLLAEEGITIVYGGGSVGSMGALADAALEKGGRLVGIMPRFMDDLEWGHKSLTELRLADDMHQRKRWMIEEVDAVVALPGGSGTFEELLEAITWKRLGLYLNPIVIVNVRGFYEPLRLLLERAIAERFMDERHRAMWTFVDGPEDVLAAIRAAPPWSPEARAFARPGAGPRG